MAKKPSPQIAPENNGLERVATGIPGLDEMMEGGLVRNSTVVVRGSTGAAKTLFCLQYLYNGAMKYNEPGIFLSFAESEEEIVQHGTRFGWGLEPLSHDKKFKILRYQPHEIVKIVGEGGGFIRDIIEAMGARRLVVDSLTAYEMLFEHKYKANESILALFDLLRKWNTTVMVTSETPVTPNRESKNRVGFLTDGIIQLYNLRSNSHRARAIEILKMRDTCHSDKIKLFGIEKDGLRIYEGVGPE